MDIMGTTRGSSSETSCSRSSSASSSVSSRPKRRKTSDKNRDEDSYLGKHWTFWSVAEVLKDLTRARNALREYESVAGDKKIMRETAQEVFMSLSMFRTIFIKLKKTQDAKKAAKKAVKTSEAPMKALQTAFRKLFATLKLGHQAATRVGAGKFSGGLTVFEKREIRESRQTDSKKAGNKIRAKKPHRATPRTNASCFTCGKRGHLSRNCKRRN